MNSKIQELEKQRIKLSKNKFTSCFFNAIVFIGTLGLIWFFVPPGDTQAYMLMGLGVILTLLFYNIYKFSFSDPFGSLKEEYHKELFNSFVEDYHPNVEWTFNQHLNITDTLFRDYSPGYSIGHFETYGLKSKNVEVTSTRISNSINSEDQALAKFQVLHFKLKGKEFPKTVFATKPIFGFLSSKRVLWFNFKKLVNSKLYYFSKDEDLFKKRVLPLLPLLNHISSKVKNIKIQFEGDEISMIFHEPIFALGFENFHSGNTFLNKEYAENLAKKINSLLVVGEALNNELQTTETEERLELKILDIAKLDRKDKPSNQSET